MNQNQSLKTIAQLIQSRDKFIITTHKRQDGDASGSASAMYHFLEEMGKDSEIITDLPPHIFAFLYDDTPWSEFEEARNLDDKNIIILDCADLTRAGAFGELLKSHPAVINIDHHYSNTLFGEHNFISEDYSSTGEFIYAIAREAGWKINQKAAEGLYVAIMTDTGRFTHGNTKSQTLRNAADLVDLGANPTKLSSKVFGSCKYGQVALRGRAISSIELFENEAIGTITLTQNDFSETETSPLDTQEFVNIPRAIDSVMIAAFFSEIEVDSKTKISIRTIDGIDANLLASYFGGGGHHRAAGCEVNDSLENAKKNFLEKASEEIKIFMDGKNV